MKEPFVEFILIHTSVKLVTALCPAHTRHEAILIHTSVKLVTQRKESNRTARRYFNPHEREARDDNPGILSRLEVNILIHTSVKLVTKDGSIDLYTCVILIHTSVKLVTIGGSP